MRSVRFAVIGVGLVSIGLLVSVSLRRSVKDELTTRPAITPSSVSRQIPAKQRRDPRAFAFPAVLSLSDENRDEELERATPDLLPESAWSEDQRVNARAYRRMARAAEFTPDQDRKVQIIVHDAWKALRTAQDDRMDLYLKLIEDAADERHGGPPPQGVWMTRHEDGQKAHERIESDYPFGDLWRQVNAETEVRLRRVLTDRQWEILDWHFREPMGILLPWQDKAQSDRWLRRGS